MDISHVPTTAGCYLFKDKNGEIIYIGKAKNLKKRVGQYFSWKDQHPKTVVLVKNIATVDFFGTDTEVEALLLENKLIKKHLPKFNIRLRDAKSYAYIKITDETFPRVISTRRVTKKGEYIGPFTDGAQRVKIVNLTQRIFQLRTCEKMPKKVCLNYHIGRCCGPCEAHISKEGYSERINAARRLLHGEVEPTILRLTHEMKAYSAKLDFENAKEKRDQIDALQRLESGQKVDRILSYDQDVIVSIEEAGITHIGVMEIKKGVLTQKHKYRFETTGTILDEFLSAYYSANPAPAEIILGGAIESDALGEYLSGKSGRKVTVTVPVRGEKRELLDLAKKNLQLSIQSVAPSVSELAKELHLPQMPVTIEAFDISNLAGTSVVSAMIVFENGKPHKEGYRLFHIKSFEGQNDFLAMYETIKRRYLRLREEKLDMPDLILIDGGRGQLEAGMKALRELGLRIPILGLAKKEEEIYLPGLSGTRELDRGHCGLRMLIAARDEVHRFVIAFHRKTRDKAFLPETL